MIAAYARIELRIAIQSRSQRQQLAASVALEAVAQKIQQSHQLR